MSRDCKIMLAGIVLLLIVGGVLLYRQSGIMKEQERLKRQIERNPFIEPSTNSDQTTTL